MPRRRGIARRRHETAMKPCGAIGAFVIRAIAAATPGSDTD